MNPPLFFFTRIGLGWMSEFMYWFRVDGGKIRVKKLQFRKYPDSYRRGGAWGLSVCLPIYRILFRQSSKAQTQSSGWDLTRLRLRSARRQQQQQQQNFIENLKITYYITFPPADSLSTNRGGGTEDILQNKIYL